SGRGVGGVREDSERKRERESAGEGFQKGSRRPGPAVVRSKAAGKPGSVSQSAASRHDVTGKIRYRQQHGHAAVQYIHTYGRRSASLPPCGKKREKAKRRGRERQHVPASCR